MGNEKLVCFASANKSKKATPDAVSFKQPKTIFEFGLPSMIANSQRNSIEPRAVRSCGRFLQDYYYFFIFSQQHVW